MTHPMEQSRDPVPSPLAPLPEDAPLPDEVMSRRTVTLDDGRSLTYYDFLPTSSEREGTMG